MIILGIDPGSNLCGYSIILFENSKISLLECGVLKFKEKLLKDIFSELSGYIDTLFQKYEIDEVAIESLFFAFNPQSVLKLAQFRGGLIFKILQKVDNYYEYTPLQVKQAVTGNGKASKEQVNFMVKRILSIKSEIKPYDVSDAIAVAITHSQRVRSV